MTASSENIPAAMNPFNGLRAFWGQSGIFNTSEMESIFKKFQAHNADMSKLVQDASARQTQALKAASERSIRYFQDLFGARQPLELIEAQSSIVSDIMENFTGQTRSWLELTQRLQEHGSAMVRDMTARADAAAETAIADEAEKFTFHVASSNEEIDNEEIDDDALVGNEKVQALLKAGAGKRTSTVSRSAAHGRKR